LAACGGNLLLASGNDGTISAATDAGADAGDSNTSPGGTGSAAAGPTTPTNKLAALHAKGGLIVDAAGKQVPLRGTNLGGWLVLENWMCGITDSVDDGQNNSIRGRFAIDTLESRFGADKTATLIEAWQDHFLTSADLDRLEAMHVNLLRLPFWYRNLQAADRSWQRDASGNIDFSRIDWLVEEAAKRNMYVFPTLHIWYGQKEKYSAISEDTDDGASQRQLAATLWQAVAHHFKGNTTVAAFDLINEPTGSAGNILQDTLYKAVRSKDPDRMVIMESVSASAASMNWTNVIYSYHEYNVMGSNGDDNESTYAQDQKTMAKWQSFPVPVFVGEFMAQPESDNQTLDVLLASFNQNRYAWSNWTYKGVNVGNWAFYNHGQGMRVNVNSDSFDTIKTKWSNMGTPSANQAVLSRYRGYWND
jgi:hypothetical protein